VNVGAAVLSPKSKDTLSQKILSYDIVKAMIAAESNTRNVLILKVLYYGGLRVSELAGLTWEDLQGDRLTVFGKGSKTRVVRLTTSLSTELQNYRTAEAGNDEPIFCSRKGKGKGFLSREYLTNLVKKAAKRVGASDSVSAHWLRHTHASHSLDKGCPISLVQATLGHSNVATTSKYLHAKPNESSSLFLD
jgi:integrase/recombinase XerD